MSPQFYQDNQKEFERAHRDNRGYDNLDNNVFFNEL